MAYQGGLRKWFAEDWRDVKTGKKCGRSGKKDKGRPYPACLLYTSPSPRDQRGSRMPSSA